MNRGTFRTLRQGTTEQELLDTLQRIIAGLDAGEYPLLADTFARAVCIAFVFASMLALSSAAFAQPRTATLDQQQMCSEQADRRFSAIGIPSGALGWDYINHYDAKTNICYMMTDVMFRAKDGTYTTDYNISDAFERRSYGFADYTLPDKEGDIVCLVEPVGETIPCHSGSEFKRLAEKYFGLVW
jgi:hypothetical protein